MSESMGKIAPGFLQQVDYLEERSLAFLSYMPREGACRSMVQELINDGREKVIQLDDETVFSYNSSGFSFLRDNEPLSKDDFTCRIIATGNEVPKWSAKCNLALRTFFSDNCRAGENGLFYAHPTFTLSGILTGVAYLGHYGHHYSRKFLQRLLVNQKDVSAETIDQFRGVLINGMMTYKDMKNLHSNYSHKTAQDKQLSQIAKHFDALEALYADLDWPTEARLLAGESAAIEKVGEGATPKHLMENDVEHHMIDTRELKQGFSFLKEVAAAALDIEPQNTARRNDALLRWVYDIGTFWKQHLATPFTVKPYKGGLYVSEALDVLEQLIHRIDTGVTRETLAHKMAEAIKYLNNPELEKPACLKQHYDQGMFTFAG